MAVRTVLKVPDPRLGARAAPVGTIGADARQLAADLIETMTASPACVGLAATQIGVASRSFVVDVTGHRKARSSHGRLVVFDPVLEPVGAAETAREGCMSVPDLTGDVRRWSALVLRGTGLDGRPLELELDAFEARAVQHEVDHLDGLVFLDRVAGPHAVFPRSVYH